MTIKTWLTDATAELQTKQISSATLDSQLILAHVLQQDKAFLITHGSDTLKRDQEAAANALLVRRLDFEPMAFLLGEREFFNITLKTDRRALIPRGETEVLVEEALQFIKKHGQKPLTIAEIGTGGGAIICAIAKNAPSHTFIATELSEEALALATNNATNLNLPIVFLQGDLCEPLTNYTGKIDLLVANLPYIAEDLLTVLDPTVQYFEPHLALSGGSDGLDIYRRFIPQTKPLLAPGASLIVEHEYDQGHAMRNLLAQTFPKAQITTRSDFSGHDRITVVET